MTKSTVWLGSDGHPTEEELLRHVDGELPSRQAEGVRTHLEACWSCRARTERIQESISAFAEFVDGPLTANLPAPPRGWSTFQPLLSKAVAERQGRSWLSRLGSVLEKAVKPPSGRLRLAWGAVLMALLLGIGIRFLPETTVSANELLQRGVEQGSMRLRQVSRPVIHQKLQIRRDVGSEQSAALSWEIWSEGSGTRFRQNVSTATSVTAPGQPVSSLLVEFGQVLEANGMDPRSPLSCASFMAWRKSLTNKDERVQEMRLATGRAAFVLRTLAGGELRAGEIVEADLTVRGDDWHPVSEQLRVRAAGEDRIYDLVETDFEVVSLASLPAAVFEVPATAPPSAPAPTPVELAAAEVSARHALHEQGADLGEPLEIVRHPGQIEVRGLAETANRKQELQVALGRIPLVRTNIVTIEEARSRPGASPTRDPFATRPLDPPLQIAGTSPPAQHLLQTYFAQTRGRDGSDRVGEGIRHDVDDFSRKALSESEAALSHAWALRRLAERYSSQEIERLRPDSKKMLESVVLDHVRALRERIGNSLELLSPIEASINSTSDRPEAAPSLPAGGTWTAASGHLFKSVLGADLLTTGLFTASQTPPQADLGPSELPVRIDPPETSLRKLVATLGMLHGRLQSLEKQVQDPQAPANP